MNLDLLTAILTGAVAIVLFTIHAITSGKHPQWITLPWYVRWGIAVTGAAFMIRSVNLLNLAPRAPDGPGHINIEGAVLAATLLYTLLAIAYWVGRDVRRRRSNAPYFADESQLGEYPTVHPAMLADRAPSARQARRT